MKTAMEMVDHVNRLCNSVKINNHQCRRLAQVYEEIGRSLGKGYKTASSNNIEPLRKVMESGELLISQCASSDWFRCVLINAENREAFEEVHGELRLWMKTIFSTELNHSTSELDHIYDAFDDIKAILETLLNIQFQQQNLPGHASSSEGRQQQPWGIIPESSLTVAIYKVTKRAQLLESLQHEKLIPVGLSEGRAQASTLEDQAELLTTSKISSWKPRMGRSRMVVPGVEFIPDVEFIPPDLAIPMSEIKVTEEALIGKGSTAEVKKAEWLGFPCAVKIFSNDNVKLVRKEVELHQMLRSIYIVKLSGLSVDGNRCMILMELMDFNLHDLILSKRRRLQSWISGLVFKHHAPFRLQDAVGLMLQIAKGMLYLHHQCILHGDLKTDNVLGQHMGKENYRLKISDFGISEKLSTDKPTVTGKQMGSGFFRAPEVLMGTVAYSLEADVYSFAMISYEILTGRRHFEDLGDVKPSSLSREVINGRRPSLPYNLHETLRDLVQRCWHGNQSMRPKFSEICDDLEHLEKSFVLKPRSSWQWEGVWVFFSAMLGFVALWWWFIFNSR